jgi:glucosamine 6-phosphate synthetase-like amidotransferase/phosphosugar isomerase protein
MNQPGFAADVADEPAVLGRVADGYADGSLLAGVPRWRRVLLTGMGSSMFAAQTAATLLRSAGLDAHAELASTVAGLPPGGDLLMVAITASGRSAETLAALERHAGTSRTLVVTNMPERIGERADLVLPLMAGPELGGISCKTYCATQAVLQLLAAHLTGGAVPLDAIRRAAETAQAALSNAGGWIDAVADLTGDAHTIYAIAPVERLSNALEAALMLREGPRLAADGCETGDWLHVDVYLSKHPRYTAFLFPGSQADEALMGWAQERGSRIVAVGRPVTGAAAVVPLPHAEHPAVALLAETIVAELVADQLWRRRIAAGAMP